MMRAGNPLEGGFDVGEGNYHVRWLMRDHLETSCSSDWDISATLNGKDQEMKMNDPARGRWKLPTASFSSRNPRSPEKPDGEPLKVKVLINFAPQESAAAAMAPVDASALVSILRTIAREPRIMKFSVVAFNLNEQRVVYRGEQPRTKSTSRIWAGNSVPSGWEWWITNTWRIPTVPPIF